MGVGGRCPFHLPVFITVRQMLLWNRNDNTEVNILRELSDIDCSESRGDLGESAH